MLGMKLTVIHPTPRTGPDVVALRRRLGWTQQRLAAALGVTVTTVARWEVGMRGVTPFAAASLMRLEREHGRTHRPRPRRGARTE
jgi:DNA-binding transcriptional regulator YiaG